MRKRKEPPARAGGRSLEVVMKVIVGTILVVAAIAWLIYLGFAVVDLLPQTGGH